MWCRPSLHLHRISAPVDSVRRADRGSLLRQASASALPGAARPIVEPRLQSRLLLPVGDHRLHQQQLICRLIGWLCLWLHLCAFILCTADSGEFGCSQGHTLGTSCCASWATCPCRTTTARFSTHLLLEREQQNTPGVSSKSLKLVAPGTRRPR